MIDWSYPNPPTDFAEVGFAKRKVTIDRLAEDDRDGDDDDNSEGESYRASLTSALYDKRSSQ